MANSVPESAFEFWKDGARQFPINNQREYSRAVRCFKRAMKLDPDFARAKGWLAYCLAISFVDGWDLPSPQKGWKKQQVLGEARRLSEEAVQIDPGDFDNYWARGYVRLHSNDPKGAESDFTEARRLNFGNRDLLVENADERVYASDPDKAIELIMRSLRIPDWHRWTLAWSYYFKARTEPVFYKLALEQLDMLAEPPGQGKSPAEACIVWAAVLAQLAQLTKDPDERARLQTLAKDKRRMFERCRGKRSLDDFRRTNPFRNKVDRDHLIKGLKLAGFTGPSPRRKPSPNGR